MHHFGVKPQGNARRDPCPDRLRSLGVSLISTRERHLAMTPAGSALYLAQKRPVPQAAIEIQDHLSPYFLANSEQRLSQTHEGRTIA